VFVFVTTRFPLQAKDLPPKLTIAHAYAETLIQRLQYYEPPFIAPNPPFSRPKPASRSDGHSLASVSHPRAAGVSEASWREEEGGTYHLLNPLDGLLIVTLNIRVTVGLRDDDGFQDDDLLIMPPTRHTMHPTISLIPAHLPDMDTHVRLNASKMS
jgi:hypothetical protein